MGFLERTIARILAWAKSSGLATTRLLPSNDNKQARRRWRLWRSDDDLRPGAGRGIDPNSVLVVHRFGFVLLTIVCVSTIAEREQLRFIANIALMAAVASGTLAVFSRETLGRGPLNRWDEAAALYAVHGVATLFG